jgi:PQQ-like domain
MSSNGNYLYAGSSTGVLYSFSGSGTLRWQIAVGAGIGSVSTDRSGSVVAVCAGDRFFVFSSKGSQLWNYTIGGIVAGGSTMIVAVSQDGNTIIGGAVGPFGDPVGTLYSFGATTGALRWSYDWGGSFAVVRAIGLASNATKIAVLTGNGFATGGTVELFNASGVVLWQKPLNKFPDSLAVTPDGSRVVVGLEGYAAGELLVYGGSDGRLLWYYAPPSDVYCVGILGGGKQVTFTAGSDLYVATVGSGIDWSVFLGGGATAQPGAHGNDVVVANHQQEIAAGNLTGTIELFNLTGTMLFSMSLPGSSVASMSGTPAAPIVWVGTSTSVIRIHGT